MSTYIGCILAVYTANIYIYCLYVACISAVYWLYIACILPAYWLYIACILAVYWLHIRCILPAFWLYIGCILAVYWLHIGCILAVYWLYIFPTKNLKLPTCYGEFSPLFSAADFIKRLEILSRDRAAIVVLG